MENTWLIFEVYNNTHGLVVNFTAWVKKVQNMIQGHTRISKQDIIDLKMYDRSIYFMVTIDEIFVRCTQSNSSHLEADFPYMIDYSQC